MANNPKRCFRTGFLNSVMNSGFFSIKKNNNNKSNIDKNQTKNPTLPIYCYSEFNYIFLSFICLILLYSSVIRNMQFFPKLLCTFSGEHTKITSKIYHHQTEQSSITCTSSCETFSLLSFNWLVSSVMFASRESTRS